jgi:hypothetical protein
LKAVTEHLIPGRWQEARLPNRKELNGTRVVSIEIDEASAKVRVGPPVDEEEDYALPVWAGILPLHELPLPPVQDQLQSEEIPLPNYIAGYSRTSSPHGRTGDYPMNKNEFCAVKSMQNIE